MIAVVGNSGTGKSYSYRNMPWDKTAIIDTEFKGFPFDPTPIKHYHHAPNAAEVKRLIDFYKTNPGNIRYVILDSFQFFIDNLLAECQASFTGYTIYNEFADRSRGLIKAMKNQRVIFVCICTPEHLKEINDSGKEVSVRRIFTHGRVNEGKLEHEFLCVLYTAARPDAAKPGTYKYHFITNTDGVCSAKTPAGMFATQLIDNDLFAALQRIDPALNTTAPTTAPTINTPSK